MSLDRQTVAGFAAGLERLARDLADLPHIPDGAEHDLIALDRAAREVLRSLLGQQAAWAPLQQQQQQWLQQQPDWQSPYGQQQQQQRQQR